MLLLVDRLVLLFDLGEEPLKVAPLEQPVTVGRISVHRNLPILGPRPQRVLRHAEDRSRLCGLCVLAQFDHGRLPEQRIRPAKQLKPKVYQSLQRSNTKRCHDDTDDTENDTDRGPNDSDPTLE